MSENETPTKKKLSTGAIVTIVIVVILILGAAGFLIWWFLFRQQSNNNRSSSIASGSINTSSADISAPTDCVPNTISPGNVNLETGSYTQTGFQNGTLAQARFNFTVGLSYDRVNCILYIADTSNHRIRAINYLAQGGPTVTTIAGSGVAGCGNPNQTPTNVNLNNPNGVFWDQQENFLLICDSGNNRILAYTPGGSTLTRWAGRSDCADSPPPTGSTNRVGTALIFPSAIVKNSRNQYFIACYSVNTNGYIARVNQEGIVSPIINNPNIPIGSKTELNSTPATGTNIQNVIVREVNALAIDQNDNLYFNSLNEGLNWVGVYQNPTNNDNAPTTQVFGRGATSTTRYRSFLWSQNLNGLLIGTTTGEIQLLPPQGAGSVFAGIAQTPPPATINNGDGGAYTAARFSTVEGLALDSNGNIWVSVANAVRRLKLAS